MQSDSRLRPEPIGKAAPGPVLRATHEACAQGVPFHVPTDMNQIRDALHWTAEVTTLVERTLADRVAMVVPADGMGRGYPLHEPGECQRSLRLDDKVPVIAEHAIREQADRILLQSCFERRKKRPIVGGTSEDHRLSDAPIDHVEILRFYL